MNTETEQIFLLTASTSQPSTTSQKIIIEPTETTQVNLENVEDFSHVCRICATITEFVLPIFDGEGLQNNLADKIHTHLPIKVTPSDVLPRVVCYQCASTLLAWHELVQCSLQAERALRARLARAGAGSQSDGTTQDSKPTNSDDAADSKLAGNKSSNRATTTSNTDAIFAVPANVAPGSAVGNTAKSRRIPGIPANDRRRCLICGDEHPESEHQKHLVTNHANMLFHCADCGDYVSRKDFILHMSLHAVQYSCRQRDEKPQETTETNVNEGTTAPEQNASDGYEQRDAPEISQSKEEVAKSESNGKISNGDDTNAGEPSPENEFSDHSDTENGFEPIPESVFAAIEESRPAEEKETSKPHRKTRTCPICGKVYRASSSYFYHMQQAHGSKREHECSTCGRRFGTKGALGQHAALHSAEARHACECGKRFRSRAGLYLHAQTHGSARWACASCPRAFATRAALQRHSLRHSAARWACARCPRRFHVRADLTRHSRTHAPARLPCAQCGKNFAQPRYLLAHTRKVHPQA